MSSLLKDKLLPSVQVLLHSCASVTILASEIQFGPDLSTSQGKTLDILINLDAELKHLLRYILQSTILNPSLFTSALLGLTWVLDLFERRLGLYRVSRHSRQYVSVSWSRLIETLQQYTMHLQMLNGTTDWPTLTPPSSLQRLFDSHNTQVQQELEDHIRYEVQQWDTFSGTPDHFDGQEESPASTYVTPPSTIADEEVYDDLPPIPGPPVQISSLQPWERSYQATMEYGRRMERAKIYDTLKSIWLSEHEAPEKGSRYLMHTIKMDSVGGVNLLVDLGVDVNQVCENDLPLCLAARNGYDQIVETLLERGAEIDKLNAYGSTALLSAAGSGHASTVALLLARHANKEAKSTSPSCPGYTPLMRAVKSGHIHAIRVLLEGGADVATQNNDGESLLHVALRNSREEIIGQVLGLRPRIEIGLADINGNTGLHVAATRGLLSVARELVRHLRSLVRTANHKQETPLHCAVAARRYKVVELLLQEGACVDSIDENRKTPLHRAVEAGAQELVKLLLTMKASPCTRDRDGKTPLHYAVDLSNKQIVQMLADGMPCVNTEDQNKETPLQYAMKSLKSLNPPNDDIVRVLLSCKAMVNSKDRAGKTPLEHVMELPQSDEERAIRLIREFLRLHEKGHTLTSTYGFPALSYAAREGRLRLIQEFCQHDPSLANEIPAAESGFEPALHEAIKSGCKQSVEKLCALPETNQDIVDREGNTPLHQAIRHPQDGLLAVLIRSGADKNRSHGKTGWPPLHFAVKLRNPKLAKELLDAGADPEKCIKGGQCSQCKNTNKPHRMNLRCVMQANPSHTEEGDYSSIYEVLLPVPPRFDRSPSVSPHRSAEKNKRYQPRLGKIYFPPR